MSSGDANVGHLARHKSVQLQGQVKGKGSGKMSPSSKSSGPKATHHVNPLLQASGAGGHNVDNIKDDHDEDFEDIELEGVDDESAGRKSSVASVLTGITAFFFVLFIVFASLYGWEKSQLTDMENSNHRHQEFILSEVECPDRLDDDVPKIMRGHNIFTTSYYGVPITLHLYYPANAYKYQDVIVVAPPFGKYAPNAYQILQEEVHLAESLNSLVVVPDFSESGWTYTEQVLGNIFNESAYDISGNDFEAILDGERASYSSDFNIRLKNPNSNTVHFNPTQQWTLGVYPYIMRLSRRFISHHYSEMNWVLYGYGSTGSLTAQMYGLFYDQILSSKYKPTRIILEPSDWYIMPTRPVVPNSFFDSSSSSDSCTFPDMNSVFTYEQEGFFDRSMELINQTYDSINDVSLAYGGENGTINATAHMVAIAADAFARPINQTLLYYNGSGPWVQSGPLYDVRCNFYKNVYEDTNCEWSFSANDVEDYAVFPYGIGYLKDAAKLMLGNGEGNPYLLDKFDSYTNLIEYLTAVPFSILMNGKMTNTNGGYGVNTDDNTCDSENLAFPLPSNSMVDYQGQTRLARVVNFFFSGYWWSQYYNYRYSDSYPFNWDYFYCPDLGYNSLKQPHCMSTWLAVAGNVDRLTSYWVNPRYGQPYFHFQTYNITLQTHCCADYWVDIGYMEGCKSEYNCEYSGPGQSVVNYTMSYAS